MADTINAAGCHAGSKNTSLTLSQTSPQKKLFRQVLGRIDTRMWDVSGGLASFMAGGVSVVFSADL